MSEFSQHIVVGCIVGACALFILWQAFGSWFGRKSLLGKCCEKGCDPQQHAKKAPEQFIPVESLSRGKRGA